MAKGDIADTKLDFSQHKLIIPDIHQRLPQLKTIEATFPRERFPSRVYLGDWFDTFSDTLKQADVVDGVFDHLASALDNPNDDVLWGNHDWHYYRPQEVASGFQQTLYWQFHNQLGEGWHQKFAHYVEHYGWLLSHAGFHLPPSRVPDITKDAYTVGHIRNGLDPVGGHCWYDWDVEWAPAHAQPQIVGHTYQHNGPSVKPGGVNLDTGLQYVGLLGPDGNVQLIKVQGR